MTLQRLFDTAWRQHWDTPRFRKSGWATEVGKYWELHIAPKFAHKECDSITSKEVRAWHQAKIATPTTANRCLEVLSKLFTIGQEQELCENNPCSLVRAFTERRRHRYATEEEMQRIGKRLLEDMETHPREVALIYLLAITGARPRSISRAKRSELERRDGVGVLRFEGKTTATTGEPETVIIPAEGLDIIDKLPIRTDGLLIGEVTYRRYWDRIRRDTGCPDLWVRDLRRTFATIGLSNGVGLAILGQLLNHRTTQTTERYGKLVDRVRLNAAKRISNRVGSLLNGRYRWR